MPAHPVCRPLSRVLTFIHAPLSQACGVDSYRVLLAEPETSPETYISTLIERLVDRAKVEAETATHVSPPPLGSLADTEHLLHRIKHIVQKDGHKTRRQVSVVVAAHLATQSEQTNIALAKMGNGIEKMGNGIEKMGAEMGQQSQCLAVQTQALRAILERTQVPTLPSLSLQSPLAQPPFDDAAASPSPTAVAHVSADAEVLSVSQ